MVVDDLVVCGAEPLFLQDYIAVGKVVPEQIATIVSGIAEGCRRAGCALLGGETAEHPGLMDARRLRPVGHRGRDRRGRRRPAARDRVRPGDVVVAMAASGLHSNGYSLARHVLLDIARMPLRRPRRGVRPHPRRGAADPTADLRQGLPGAGRRDRACARSRTSPAAGWRATWSGCCRRAWSRCVERGSWTPAAGVRPDRRARPGRARGDGAARSTWASAWWPCCPPTTSTARWRCSPPGTCPRGCSARCAGEIAGATLYGDHPRF